MNIEQFYNELKSELEDSQQAGFYIVTPSCDKEKLDNEFEKFNAQSQDQKEKADNRSMTLYGMTNYDHYYHLLSKIKKGTKDDEDDGLRYDKDDKEVVREEYDLYNIPKEFNCNSSSELDEKIKVAHDFNDHTIGRVIIYPTKDANELESLYFKYMALNLDSRSASDNKAREMFGKPNRDIYAFIKNNIIKTKNDEIKGEYTPDTEEPETNSIFTNDLPLVTPEELVQKVHENYSCFNIEDAESIKRWRQEYALMGMGIKTENYNKYNLERINILRKAIYENNEEAIIQCGWVPGIEFNSENRVKASQIVKEKMDKDYGIISEAKARDYMPEKCTKCGSTNIGTFIKGEPVYLCKDCGEYLGTVPRRSKNESYIEEAYIRNEKDIYYNKDKFDSGEINLCFITGHSGSGKSTMGRDLATKKNVEHYELDDVVCNDNFSDDNLKEYGDLIYSFFKGPGKKYRNKTVEELANDFNDYEKEIITDFVKYSLTYCKSHKDTKYVLEGIWLFWIIKPETLKDCAVYIKGTSAVISLIRAAKRDFKENDKPLKSNIKWTIGRIFEDTKNMRSFENNIEKYRKYFSEKITNESYIEEASGRNLYPVYAILFSNDTKFGKMIRKVTGSPYSHATVSLDPSLNDMYSFSDIPYNHDFNSSAGFVRESIYSPMYQQNRYFTIFVTFTDKEGINRFNEKLSVFKSNYTNYDYNDIGLVQYYFKMKNTKKHDETKKLKWFCSEFVSYMLYVSTGFDEFRNILQSPDDLQYKSDMIEIGQYTLKSFDEKDVIKKTKRAKQEFLKRRANRASVNEISEDVIFEDFIFNDEDKNIVLEARKPKDYVKNEKDVNKYTQIVDWKYLYDEFIKLFKGTDPTIRFSLFEIIIRDYIVPLKLRVDMTMNTIVEELRRIYKLIVLPFGDIVDVNVPERAIKASNKKKVTTVTYPDFKIKSSRSITESDETLLDESSNSSGEKAVSIILFMNKNSDELKYSNAYISLDDDISNIYSYSLMNGLTYGKIREYNKDEAKRIYVYTVLVSDKIHRSIKTVLDNFNVYINNTKYSILKLLTVPVDLSVDTDIKMVCSEFANTLLTAANVNLSNKKNALISVRDDITTKIIEVFNGHPSNFSTKEIEKRIKKLKKSNLPIVEFVEYNDTITEAKSFPVQFDSDGNLILKNIRKIDFEQEYANSHRLLKEYENTKSYEPMKFELAKMQFFITLLEKKIYKNGKDKTNSELKVRARFLNDFKKYLKIVTTNDPNFNFTEYYEQSPFNDALIKIDKSTLKFGFEALKYLIK